jgi:signal transduction histidine kinase
VSLSRPANQRILIVDDNLENTRLLEQLLQHDGHDQIRSVNDPSLAMTVFESWRPDLVLLDLHMPAKSGYDILQELRPLRDAGDYVPVLVWTADQTMAARVKALDLGADDFITKPFDATELLLRVRNFLRTRELHCALGASERSASQLAIDLRVANRELEGFVHSVSHDLRGPLRAILSNVRMLQEDLSESLEPEHVAMLDRQAVNATRLSNIVDELLKLARIARAPLNKLEFDLSKMAQEVIGELEFGAPVEFRIQDGMRCKADPLLTRMVLLNLIGNAAKFSPDGGAVEIGDDGKAYFVRDEGIGFDESHVERMFEPFQRLVSDAEFPGNGVGLANVKRIVDRHGGRVWATSQPGEGACFYFTLSR